MHLNINITITITLYDYIIYSKYILVNITYSLLYVLRHTSRQNKGVHISDRNYSAILFGVVS